MKKITQKDALLNLVKHLDVGNVENQPNMASLFKKLSLSQTVIEVDKRSKAEVNAFSEKIKSKPILEKFANTPLQEDVANYLVEKKSNSAFMERLTNLESNVMHFNQADRLGPLITDNGSESWLEFKTLQSAISVSYTGNATPIIYATISKPLTIHPYRPERNPEKPLTVLKREQFEKIEKKFGELSYLIVDGIKTAIGSAYSLTKGTIWLSAALFKLGEPADKYIGFRILEGVLAFPVATTIRQTDIKIASTIKFSLSLSLDHSVTALSKPESYGIDAYEMELQLPKSIDLHFSVKNVLKITSSEEISLSIYGKQYPFQMQTGNVKIHPTSNSYAVELTTTPTLAFEIKESKSESFKIDGQADIQSAYWFLSQRTIQSKQPTTITSNGSLGLILGSGLSFFWQGLANKEQFIQLKNPLLTAGYGKFQIVDKETDFFQQSELYQLWETDKNLYNTLTLSFAQKKSFTYICYVKEGEGVGVNADANFQLDRPFQADGIPISPELKNCSYVKMANDQEKKIILLGPNKVAADKDLAQPETLHQFAINNAFFTTTDVKSIQLSGPYDDNQLISGILKMNFGLLNLEPILPHPYAFSNAFQKFYSNQESLLYHSKPTTIQCVCQWNIKEDTLPNIDFALPKNSAAITNGWFRSKQQEDNIYKQEDTKPRMEAHYPNIKTMCTLVDVSTGYDYLGISMVGRKSRNVKETPLLITENSEDEVTISRMFLEAPMRQLAGITLPQVSWEPYVNLTPPEISGNENLDPKVGIFNFTSSSEPTIFFQNNAKSLKIDPLAYMQRFKENLRPSNPSTKIQFADIRQTEIYMSLPHGKLAMAQLGPFNAEQLTLNQRQYDVIQPHFKDTSIAEENAKGGWQFRIAADDQGEFSSPLQTGWAFQLSNAKNITDLTNGSKNESPLGSSPHGFFQNVFKGENHQSVPITHLDCSGYGASTYSNWKDPEAKYATVAQVKFDILRGRVAHEIVQVATMIYPWGIAVTRTITFYKQNNAIIYREDSGWVAKSEGLFDFSYNDKEGHFHHNPYEIHPGHIQGLFNIRNIKEIDAEKDKFTNNPESSSFVAVSFDADVAIEHISSPNTDGKVPGWGFKGYLQLTPIQKPVEPSDLIELFQRKQNNIGGNVDAIMQLAGGDQQLKVKRVDMSVSSQGIYVVAARGTVMLPADGSWSVIEINKDTQEVTPITDKQSVPVYKIGIRDVENAPFSVAFIDNLSKITSPNALFNPDMSPQYGYLQNTGTQKLLFPNPFYDKDEQHKLFSDPTKLADSFTLMNSKGIFPNIDKTINAEDPGTSTTDIVKNGLKKIINKTLDDRGTFDIIGTNNDDFRIYADYKVDYQEEGQNVSQTTLLEYATNSESVDEPWKNHMSDMSIHVDMGPFKPIMTISGNFSAKSGLHAEIGTGANAPQLKLPPALDKIYNILQFLDSLDFTNVKNNVEAVKKGLQVVMSNGADAWDYKFKAEKEIPFVKFPFDAVNYNSPTTPLKMDASFKMGCYFNMPIKVTNAIDQLTPSVGAFLELKADIRVMCVSLAAATIYAKGTTQVGLAADMKNLPTLYFKFGFGAELCVGLPVIGSVSVTYMVAVDMSINDKVFTVGAFIYFRGRIELAFGMVEVAISIEAGGRIEKPDNESKVYIIATATFALDITVAFVIDLDFNKTWIERRQIAASLDII